MTVRSAKRRFWGICVVTIAVSLWLLIQINTRNTHRPISASRRSRYMDAVNETGLLVNTTGCRIPYINPFDPSILEFIYEEEDSKCEETYGLALVESSPTTLFINKSALPYYNIRSVTDLRCCYTPFWRVEFEKNSLGRYPKDVDLQVRYANTCTHFTDQVKVTEEFVKVQCFLRSSTNNKPIYTDFHAFPQIKFDAERQKSNQQSGERVSVIIVGVDSVSRLNLHRQMPLTLDFLKYNLSAVEFLGYNKVEDNTFLNVIPVLTGVSEEELRQSCWPSDDSVFDNCSFIWDQFRETGYSTAFSEDSRSEGGIFSYLYRGFRKQPTDFYPKPFNVRTEAEIGFNKMDSFLCLGPRKSLKVLLNNAFKFSYSMKNVPSFVFAWGCSLTHDLLNMANRVDVDHKEFLESLYNAKILDNTILVFMSDHGMRHGEFRETYQGYLEERMPFLFIAYPDWFSKKYTTAVSNLRSNSQTLTSPFDLHETLVDIVNLTSLEKDVLRTRSQELEESDKLPRGISLFLPIPGVRACKDAGIDDHWCTCHESVSVSLDHTQVRGAANYLVDHINTLLKDYPRCAVLQLLSITNAREEKFTSHISQAHEINFSNDVNITDYSVTVETKPGKALFESTVRYNADHNNFTVVGIVSRINLYGDQSRCISHYRNRMYCYCI